MEPMEIHLIFTLIRSSVVILSAFKHHNATTELFSVISMVLVYLQQAVQPRDVTEPVISTACQFVMEPMEIHLIFTLIQSTAVILSAFKHHNATTELVSVISTVHAHLQQAVQPRDVTEPSISTVLAIVKIQLPTSMLQLRGITICKPTTILTLMYALLS